jgi:hypothetical protein
MDQILLSQAYQTLNKLWQRTLSIPSDIALFISNLEFVEDRILRPQYQKSIREYQPLLNSLSPEENRIVQELEQYGIAITTLEELAIPNSDRFFQAAENISQEFKQNTQHPFYKGKHTLTANAEQIMRHPELFLWGADAKLLRIVEGYLKLPVAYDGLSYYYAVADNNEAGPRKWHRDKEDWQMIKVAVYINDVDEDGGPFQFATPSANELLNKALRSKSIRKYKTAFSHEVEGILPETMQNNWRKSCTGKSGTVIFADTARYYHRGKPPTKLDRSAVFFGYCSSQPRHPFFCGRSPLSEEELRYMATLLPEETRNCVTWRDRLNGISRFVPKNRLKV